MSLGEEKLEALEPGEMESPWCWGEVGLFRGYINKKSDKYLRLALQTQ